MIACFIRIQSFYQDLGCRDSVSLIHLVVVLIFSNSKFVSISLLPRGGGCEAGWKFQDWLALHSPVNWIWIKFIIERNGMMADRENSIDFPKPASSKVKVIISEKFLFVNFWQWSLCQFLTKQLYWPGSYSRETYDIQNISI